MAEKLWMQIMINGFSSLSPGVNNNMLVRFTAHSYSKMCFFLNYKPQLSY